jgi:hypothetical protein
MGGSRTWWWLDASLAVGTAAVLAYGVLVLGWPVFAVMALFWFENVVIGGFNVAKMLTSGARLGLAGVIGGVALAAFFTVHYGMFTAVHGVFVVALFGGELGQGAMNGGLFEPLLRMLDRLLASRDGWLAAAAIVTLHATGFVQWLIATRDAPTPLKELMGAPYGRIVVLHVTLIAGAFLVQALKAPVAGALLLITLKLAYDLVTLRRAQAPKDATPKSPAWQPARRNADERP